MDIKITSDDVLQVLKRHKLSITAAGIAEMLGRTTSRAVATAARKLVDDQQIKRTFAKGKAWYRFVRLTPRRPT